MPQTSLIYYPGHLGPVGPDGPRTRLRDATRGVLWDRQIKPIPQPDATDLVLYNGMHRAVTVDGASAAYQVPKTKLRELIKAGAITTAEHQGQGAAKAEVVVVLDPDTVVVLRREAKAPAPQSKES